MVEKLKCRVVRDNGLKVEVLLNGSYVKIMTTTNETLENLKARLTRIEPNNQWFRYEDEDCTWQVEFAGELEETVLDELLDLDPRWRHKAISNHLWQLQMESSKFMDTIEDKHPLFIEVDEQKKMLREKLHSYLQSRLSNVTWDRIENIQAIEAYAYVYAKAFAADTDRVNQDEMSSVLHRFLTAKETLTEQDKRHVEDWYESHKSWTFS